MICQAGNGHGFDCLFSRCIAKEKYYR